MKLNKRGNTWEVYIGDKRLPGRRYRKGGFRTKADARAHGVVISSELATGEYFNRLAREEQQRTFSAWWETYILACEKGTAGGRGGQNTPKTISNKTGMWRNHIKPLFGEMMLHDFEVRHANRLALEMSTKDMSPNSINLALAVLRHMLATAQRWGIIERVCEIPNLNTTGTAREDFLSEPELQEVVGLLSGQDQLLVLFGARTGLRMGELRALKWGDVMTDASRWRVRVRRSVTCVVHPEPGEAWGPTKGKRARKVPLSSDVQAMLEAHPRGLRNPFVFRGKGGQGEISRGEMISIGRAINRGFDKHFHWHILRHTFASHLVQRGVPLPVIQELGGWSSLQHLMRYAHLAPDGSDLINAVAALDAVPPVCHGTQQQGEEGR